MKNIIDSTYINLFEIKEKDLYSSDLTTMDLIEIQVDQEYGIEIFKEKIIKNFSLNGFLFRALFKSEDYDILPKKIDKSYIKILENGGYLINGDILNIDPLDAREYLNDILSRGSDSDFVKFDIGNIIEAAWWGVPEFMIKEKLIVIDDKYIYLIKYY